MFHKKSTENIHIIPCIVSKWFDLNKKNEGPNPNILKMSKIILLLVSLSDRQVSSGLLDSSQYSVWSQQCSSLDGLKSSSDFLFFHLPFHAFGHHSKCTNYNWYHLSLLHSAAFFSSLAKSKYFSIFLLCFIFTLWSGQNPLDGNFSFFFFFFF